MQAALLDAQRNRSEGREEFFHIGTLKASALAEGPVSYILLRQREREREGGERALAGVMQADPSHRSGYWPPGLPVEENGGECGRGKKRRGAR